MRIHSDSDISALLDRFEKIPILERDASELLKAEEFEELTMVDACQLVIDAYKQKNQIYFRSISLDSDLECLECERIFANSQIILVSPLLNDQYIIPSISMHYMLIHDEDTEVEGSYFSFESCEAFVFSHYREYAKLGWSIEK